MPNGRGSYFATESVTIAGVGEFGARALEKIHTFIQINDNRDSFCLVHIGSNPPDSADYFFDLEDHDLPDESHSAFLPTDADTEDCHPGHTRAGFRESVEEHVLSLRDILDTAVRSPIPEESETDGMFYHPLHLVLILYDSGTAIGGGLAPLLTCLVYDITQDLDIGRYIGGLGAIPVAEYSEANSVTSPSTSVLRRYANSYVTFRELGELQNKFEWTTYPTEISFGGELEFDISHSPLHLNGVITDTGAVIDGETRALRTAVGATEYLTTQEVATTGYGPLRVPGIGFSHEMRDPLYLFDASDPVRGDFDETFSSLFPKGSNADLSTFHFEQLDDPLPERHYAVLATEEQLDSVQEYIESTEFDPSQEFDSHSLDHLIQTKFVYQVSESPLAPIIVMFDETLSIETLPPFRTVQNNILDREPAQRAQWFAEYSPSFVAGSIAYPELLTGPGRLSHY